jgi:predicted amidophosphoribosyltransferase
MEGVRYAGAQRPAEGLLCSLCRMAPPAFSRAVAYAAYGDELREMVHLLKYERMSSMVGLLGGRLAAAIATLEGAAAKELTGCCAAVSGEGTAARI